MKKVKTLMLGLAVMAGTLIPLSEASAWVAARGGYRGGAVAVGGFHGGYYGGYHGGCYGCGAAAGAVAGMAVGAAIASTAYPAYSTYPSTVVVQQPAPVYVQQPSYVAQGNLPLGTQLAVLPAGSNSMVVNGTNYYQNGPTWYKPYYGSSGVYYEVVPAP